MARGTLEDPRGHGKTHQKNLEVMGIDWSDKTTAASDRANWKRINVPHGTGGTKSKYM